MSTVTVSEGSAWNCSQVHETGSSIAPRSANSHRSSAVCGVGPAESTGKSSVTYWPGGTRPASASSRRRPLKPLETNPIGSLLVVRRTLSGFPAQERRGGFGVSLADQQAGAAAQVERVGTARIVGGKHRRDPRSRERRLGELRIVTA